MIAPASAFDITIDYYRIAIDDRIVLSGNFTAPPIAVLLAPFGANSARFFTNAIDTRTNGVDVTANYRLALQTAGDVQLRAGYNNTRSRVVGAIATPPQLAGFESVLFDRIERRRIECGQPKDSLRLGGDWRRNRFGVNVDVARYGEFCSFTLNPADDQTYPAKWLTDVEASYRTAGLHAGDRRAEPVQRVPGPQYDRELVQRDPDVPEPFAVRDERPHALHAPRVDVLTIDDESRSIGRACFQIL